MLYWIAEHLGFTGLLNLIRYQSFRTGAAVATALFIGLIIGPRFIGWLRVRQGKGQPIRADGPQTHLAKRGTPTMGGLMILTSMALAILIWMDLSNPYVWACLFVTLGFGAIGFLDDYDKVRKASTAGVSGKTRLLLEFAIAGIASWIIMQQNGPHLYLPFTDRLYLDLGYAFPLFAAFTIVAFGNAVNLTDGLDGLATMPVIIASVAFMLIVYLAGNVKFATYLGIPHVPGAGELAIFCGAVVGAGTRLPVVQRAARCGVHGRYRQPAHWAARSGRSRSSRTTRSCWASSAACSSSRRCRSSSRCSSTSAPASACSAWRRSTIISNN